MRTMMLKNKVALVTGGSRGIGRGIAEQLAKSGATVVVTGRSVDQLQEVATHIGGHAYRMDVSDRASTDETFAAIVAQVGPPTVLVNNAGISDAAPIHRASDSDWDRIMEVNVTSAFRLCRLAVPAMMDQGWGRIVNVASNAGLSGYQYTHAYCASKHALIGLTRSTAHELARTGITVNAVCPGWVDTQMFHEAVARIVRTTGRSEDKAKAALVGMSPARRAVTVAEVAHAVLMLCADSASGINGQALPIDGGQVMK